MSAESVGGAALEGVVLLHGIARSAASMRLLERAFRNAGFATLNLDYPARQAAIGQLVALLAPEIERFASRVDRLHFVTHSMGGLVTRALITRRRPGNLGRVVMLAPPNQGSEVADRLHALTIYRRFFGPAGAQLVTTRSERLTALLGAVDYPLGIIAGDRSYNLLESWWMLPGANDGRVTVERTRLPGMADHLTLHATHGLMMWNPRVIREAVHFVQTGRFGAAALSR